MEATRIHVVFDFFNSLAYLVDGQWQLPYEAKEVMAELTKKVDVHLFVSNKHSEEWLEMVLNKTYAGIFTSVQRGEYAEDAIKDIPGLKLLVSDSVMSTHSALHREFRGVWFNNYYCSAETQANNSRQLMHL
jgi:hypothetical protein